MAKKHINSEYRFNIEIYKVNSSKELKISNMPIDKLEQVAIDLKEKYC